MRISVAQLNYKTGDFKGNRDLICDAIEQAKTASSDLVIFSELSVTGCAPGDYLKREEFIVTCNKTIQEIAERCNGISAIIGAPTRGIGGKGKKLFNSALLLSDGKILFTANKARLSDYAGFEECRYFEPEPDFSVINFMGVRIALAIGEDLQHGLTPDDISVKQPGASSPMELLSEQHPDIIINISAIPFSFRHVEERKARLVSNAARFRVPLVTCNLVGANTELVYDGASMIIDGNGNIVNQLAYFEEDLYTFDLETLQSGIIAADQRQHDAIELIHKALVTGIRDYFSKSGVSKCIAGLSGGIDSAVCIALASEALGSENVMALILPSRYSSEHSITDSIVFARNLGISYEIIDIDRAFTSFQDLLAPFLKKNEPGTTEENIQARIRAILLMAFSNSMGSILLNTSNKSEAAVGYGTLYGDMAGGLSVLGDVYKTDVYRLAGYINRHREIIPENIITKPPSAELKPNQYDTDSLPEYNILDPILYQYIELRKTMSEILEEELHDKSLIERVVRMVNSNVYKRYQAPPVLIITAGSPGFGKNMPVVASYPG